MAEVFPQTLEIHESPNLRLGIKSSLNSLKPLVASLYIIYKASEGSKKVYYSEEMETEYTSICLSSELKIKIDSLFSQIPDVSDLVAKSQLFFAQIEALQVGIELFFHLGKINFVGQHQERTGNNRYQKYICFSDKMMVLDLFLSAHSDKQEVYSLLHNWLLNKSVDSGMELNLKKLLTTFTEDSYYKIKKVDGSEIIFNPESIYKTLLASGEVLLKDGDQEIVGPLRILGNFVSEGMHPAIKRSRSTLSVKDNMQDWLESYTNLVAISLDLIPRNLPIGYSNSQDNASVINTIIQDKTDLLPYISAIRTKPFLLLAGISGSGKSRIVRELARACWPLDSDERKAKKPENYELIQVKPNWHDSSELIGYVSHIDGEKYVYGKFLPFVTKAWANLDKPYFLCLDEMNLAPVEQYFAEYLSVIETRKLVDGVIVTDPILESPKNKGDKSKDPMKIPDLNGNGGWFDNFILELTYDNQELHDKFMNEGIALPPNLVVVGTVNMDETTFTFSRKVLDRAMTIEMNDVDLRGGLTESPEDSMVLEPNQIIGDAVEGKDVYADNKEVCDKVIEYLETINAELEGTPFKIGYRARNEFLLYALNRIKLTQTDGSDEAMESVLNKALDEMTSMKILSRIEGEDQRVRTKTGEALLPKLRKIITDRLGGWEIDENKPISVAKLEEMEAKLANTGFTSFWS